MIFLGPNRAFPLAKARALIRGIMVLSIYVPIWVVLFSLDVANMWSHAGTALEAVTGGAMVLAAMIVGYALGASEPVSINTQNGVTADDH